MTGISRVVRQGILRLSARLTKAASLAAIAAVAIVLLMMGCSSQGTVDGDRDTAVSNSTQELAKGTAGSVRGDADYCDDPGHLCASGEGDCDTNSQCQSGLSCAHYGPRFGLPSSVDVCVAASCRNGAQDGAETSVDCGGSLCGPCYSNCTGTLGSAGFCSQPGTCLCGKGQGPCVDSAECQPGLQCIALGVQFGLASATKVCVPPHCSNRIQDGDETGVDCSNNLNSECGQCLAACGATSDGSATFCDNCICGSKQGDCDTNYQCQSPYVCGHGLGAHFGFTSTTDVCVAAHCTNGALDAVLGETGIDCGGADCGTCLAACTGSAGSADFCNTCLCSDGQGDCDSDTQCATGLVCRQVGPRFGFSAGTDVCVPPHCANSVKDADELGVDCGGACGTCPNNCTGTPGSGTYCVGCRCQIGQGDCDSSAECETGLVCRMFGGGGFHLTRTTDVCAPAHCNNGAMDPGQGETGVDCGGDCGVCLNGDFEGGLKHACAIAYGNVRCWGDNSFGQLGNGTTTSSPTPTVVPGLTINYVSAAAGDHHSCAAARDGSVKCWGDNSFGQLGDGSLVSSTIPVSVAGLPSVSKIRAGANYTCALTTLGKVYCWGSNSNGQIGTSPGGFFATPSQVSGLSLAVDLAVGPQHACAALSNGSVRCWGAGGSNRLGNNNSVKSGTPVTVIGVSGVHKVAAGAAHSCALTAIGDVACWGANTNGQIGNGVVSASSPSAFVTGVSGIVDIASADNATCAVLGTGAVKCWGQSDFGQVGAGTTQAAYPTATTALLGFGKALSIGGGSAFFCAQTTTGMSCWGDDTAGELGKNTVPLTPVPTTVASEPSPTVTAVSAGAVSTCGISQGKIYCWGDNDDGEVGDGTFTQRRAATLSSGGYTDATAVSVGGAHACALRSGGSLLCWGRNDQGQLGNNSTTSTQQPVPVANITSATKIAAGSNHTCAIQTGGALACWGGNTSGQLGLGDTTNRGAPVNLSLTGVTAVAAASLNTCALLSDGSVRCWGNNQYKQIGDNSAVANRLSPTAVSGLPTTAVSVAAGEKHACAALGDGSVYCWGDNSVGQLGLGTTSTPPIGIPGPVTGISDAVSVSSKGSTTCVIRSGGGIKCWGANEVGQTGNGSTVTTPTPTSPTGTYSILSVGVRHACAVRIGSGLRCWGYNDYGQVAHSGAWRYPEPFPWMPDFSTDPPDTGSGGTGGTGGAGASGAAGGASSSGGSGGSGTTGCTPTCASKVCGESLDDGCGGMCPPVCPTGSGNCVTDWDCGAGYSCGIGAGRYFGASGTNACWPIRCNDLDPHLPGCGIGTASCGTACSACLPQCDGRSCGSDGCGGICGSCSSQEACNPKGECVPQYSYTEIHAPDFPAPLPDVPTAPVGAVPGSLSVSRQGIAQYSIPIAVPPGRQGLTPSLSFHYQSIKAEGLMGPGWSLSGFSAISRCPRPGSQSSSAHGVAYDDSDKFCLDGQQLFVAGNTSPLYGEANSEYRTDVESFSKIVLKGPVADSSGNYLGPDHFEVFTKSGQKLIYGASNKATLFTHGVKRLWALQSVIDRAGSIIDIQYSPHEVNFDTATDDDASEPDTGELLPESLVYGGHTNGQLGDRWIKFNYEDRPDPVFHFTQGARSFSLRRLKSITTGIGESAVTNYQIGYPTDSPVTRVTSISQCAGDSITLCKPATNLSYLSLGVPQDSSSRTTVSTANGRLASVLDQDGDGRSDLVFQDSNGAWQIARTRMHSHLEYTDIIPLPWSSSAIPNYTADFNRDGLADLVDPGGNLILSDSAHPDAPFKVQGFPAAPGDLRDAAVLDFNGDGRPDFAECAGTQFALYTGINDTLSDPRLFFELGRCDRIRPIDVDGDGADEILSFDESGNTSIAKIVRGTLGDFMIVGDGGLSFDPSSGMRILDFNGDGLKDILEILPTNTDYELPLRLWENTGSDAITGALFRPHPIELKLDVGLSIPDIDIPTDGSTFSNLVFAKAVVLDTNGDGRDDIVVVDNGKLISFVASDRFAFSVSAILGIPYDTIFLGDLEGDGNQKIIGFRDLSPSTIYSHGFGARRDGLLQSIVDGVGHTFSIFYGSGTLVSDGGSLTTLKTFEPSGCAARLPNSNVACAPALLPLVSEYTENITDFSGSNIGKIWAFAYRWNVRALDSHGLLGFGEVERQLLNEFNVPVSVQTQGYYLDDYVRAGQPSFSTTVSAQTPATAAAKAESLAVYNTFDVEVGNSPWGRPFPQLLQLEATVASLTDDGVKFIKDAVTSQSVNQWGDVEERTTVDFDRNNNAQYSTIAVSSFYPPDETRWILGLLEDFSVTSERAGEAVTRNYHYDYIGGLLKDVIREKDDTSNLYLKQTLFRDNPFGAIDGFEATDFEGETRGVHVDLDPKGIFPTTVTNALGHIREVDIDPRTGNTRTTADPNRIFAQAGYDGFGRVGEIRSGGDIMSVVYSGATPITSTLLSQELRPTLQVVTSSASGGQSTRRMDAAGRLVSTEELGFGGAVVSQEFAYDSLGRLTGQTLPHLRDETTQGAVGYAYDELNRLTQLSRPDGSMEHWLYADWSSVTDSYAGWLADPNTVSLSVAVLPNGNVHAHVTDLHDNASTTIEAEGLLPTQMSAAHLLKRTFGPFDSLETETDQAGNVAFYVPDALGRLIDHTDSNSGHEHIVRSAWGEVTETTDGNGFVREQKYDLLGRLRRYELPGGELIAEWMYDGPAELNQVGRLLSTYRQAQPGASTGNGVSFAYEQRLDGIANRGLLKAVTYHVAGEDGSITVLESTTDYDEFGRPLLVHYPKTGDSAGLSLKNEYDAASGLVLALSDNVSGAEFWRLTEADHGFRPKTELVGGVGGMTVHNEYYQLGDGSLACSSSGELLCMPGALRSIKVGTGGATDAVDSVEYAYDRNGNVAGRTRKSHAAEQFVYNGFDQLTQYSTVDASFLSLVYTYDELGNLKTQTGVGTYDYTGPGPVHGVHRLLEDGTQYLYDGNGNQYLREGPSVEGGHQELSYNDFDMPWQISVGTGSSTKVTKIGYDASGHRVVKNTGGTETIYFGEMYEKVTDLSSVGQHFKVFAGDRQVVEVVDSQIGAAAVSRSVHYLHSDGLGSVTTITDAAGAVEERRSYQPFGAPETAMSIGLGRTGFAGLEHDSEAGLINMRGRLYDPKLGQFLQSDPLAGPFPRHRNGYAYAQSNPLSMTDPTGLFSIGGLLDSVGQILGIGGYDNAKNDGDRRADSTDTSNIPLSTPKEVVISVNEFIDGKQGTVDITGNWPGQASLPVRTMDGPDPVEPSTVAPVVGDVPGLSDATNFSNRGDPGRGAALGGSPGGSTFKLTLARAQGLCASGNCLAGPGASILGQWQGEAQVIENELQSACESNAACAAAATAAAAAAAAAINAVIENAQKAWDWIKVHAKAPGVPTAADGFDAPKGWNGKTVPNPNGPGVGYPDSKGRVWIPTGPTGHGGPHWDVQKPGGGYDNVYPGGKIRPGKP